MYCTAGVGAHVDKIIEVTMAAEELVAIDGCPAACASKCLKLAGFEPKVISLPKLGFVKGKSPANEANCGDAFSKVIGAIAAKVNTEEASQAQIRLPRLLDLGAEKCIPCKMMAPILEELREEYAGRLQVDFIDVRKNPEASKQYSIRTIPTQIFYNLDGKELHRHTGFMGKEDILATFRKKGIDLGER
jgi:thioredoxin 1